MIYLKIKKTTLIIFILIPLLIGGISALLSMGAMKDFALINKPPLSPPAWLFPVVWTVLYVLMGISSYIIYTAPVSDEKALKALIPYGIQLIFNFFWSIIFFNLEWYLFAFIWLVIMLIFILITFKRFYEISKFSGFLLIPYILWTIFAGYLNFGIYLLN